MTPIINWVVLPKSSIDIEIAELLQIDINIKYNYIALCVSDPTYKPNDIGYTYLATQYDTLVSKEEFIKQYYLNKIESYL